MILHDQSADISAEISKLNKALKNMGYGNEQTIHTEPLIRGEDPIFKLEARVARNLSQFIKDNLTYFQRFSKVILYYDNGQHELNRLDKFIEEKIMNGKQILYNGQVLTLTKYFGLPCLFINNSSQISIPKMQFVGGYPNEYCIYLKDLTEKEISLITDLSGNKIDIDKELEKVL